MPKKKTSSKAGGKPERMSREARHRRTVNVIFLAFCVLMILSLIITAFAKF